MFVEILSPLLAVLIIAVMFMASKLREFYKEKQLRELVSWIMVNNTLCVSHDLPLWTYISNAQYKYGIKKEYCITEEQDWEIVKKILERFKTDIAQLYFKGELRTIKSKYVINGEHYFMLSLYSFLQKHQCDYDFLGYDMHKETISYKQYGSWGGTLFDATYALTDFAVVYHKMYYIACVFCKNCKPIIESKMPLFIDEKGIEEILNTKQIQISRY